MLLVKVADPIEVAGGCVELRLVLSELFVDSQLVVLTALQQVTNRLNKVAFVRLAPHRLSRVYVWLLNAMCAKRHLIRHTIVAKFHFVLITTVHLNLGRYT